VRNEVIEAAARCGGNGALVTVIATKGSVPRHAGSRMLVRPDGSTVGTVGGGRPEAGAVERGAACAADGIPVVFTMEMHGTQAAAGDPVCGGTLTMLVEPLRDPDPYARALALLESGSRALLVKEVPAAGTAAAAAPTLMDQTGAVVCGPAGRASPAVVERCLSGGRPAYEEEGRLFYDPLFPDEKLLIMGGGHVGRALAVLATRVDFRVTVVDERPEFASPERFPAGVEVICGPYGRTAAVFPFDSATYAVIVTPGHVSDLECVRAVLPRTYRYAGFIGSARKTALLLAQASNDGFDPAKVDGLYAPIGLDINAETPEELAVCILAELIAVRRNSPALAAADASRRARRLAGARGG
jgi:xanthine dehydrogenase accessory factor